MELERKGKVEFRFQMTTEPRRNVRKYRESNVVQ